MLIKSVVMQQMHLFHIILHTVCVATQHYK